MKLDAPQTRLPRRSMRYRLVASIALCVLLGLVWGIWRWTNSPNAPDVRTATLGTVISFMGTDDYSRMVKSERSEYAIGVLQRLLRMTIESFYRRPDYQRDLMLKIFTNVRAAQASEHPEILRDPTPQELRRNMRRLLVHQPTRVQGMIAQFMMDFAKPRQVGELSAVHESR